MSDSSDTLLTNGARSDWIRLRTLILLRWLAVSGQSAAVLVAHYLLDIDLPLDLTSFAIAASAAFNIISTLVHPESKRLSERDAALTLLFDLLQLCALLFLTGGLTNPFSILVLVPVTICASALTLRATIALALIAVALISVMAVWHVPLRYGDGTPLTLPPTYTAGVWTALMISIVFLALYARRVTVETFTMSQALVATQMALAREQRLTALGGLVAAAAHELGTPLATIKLTASELLRDAEPGSELREDLELIRDQSDRCRDILRALGSMGKDDTHLRFAPVSALVEEAAEPHAERGKRIVLRVGGKPCAADAGGQPEIRRHPEIIHGLRNLIQNAVDFADSHVWIDIDWDEEMLRIAVGDDGPGYPPDMLGRIGDPFIRARGSARSTQPARPEYEGMGLGLFIAKTLLERSGAHLTFANGSEEGAGRSGAPLADPDLARPPGAIAEVVWPRAMIEAPRSETRGPLAPNPSFDLTDR